MVATYEVSEITLPEQAAATIRETTSLANIGAALSEMLGTVQEYLTELEVQPAGPPFARYYAVGPGGVDLEAGFPVTADVPKRWRIVPARLPGGPAAATWHTGSFETIGQAYEALESWLREHARKRSGPPWEVYWTNPAELPDQAQWRTQVVQPLAR